MASGIEIDGLQELISKLDNLDDRINRGINTVLRDSAEYVQERIEINVNVSATENHHARDDVMITRVRSGGEGRDNNYVQVGYASVGWRMYFVEFGTRYQDGQNIIEESTVQSAADVRDAQIRGLSELLHG